MPPEEIRGSELANLRREVGALKKDIDHLKKDMWIGNGKPGVTTRILRLEETVDRIEQSLTKFEYALTDPDGVLSRLNSKVDALGKYIWMGLGGLAVLQFLLKIKG